jgi:glycosyltransferase 2 family protein
MTDPRMPDERAPLPRMGIGRTSLIALAFAAIIFTLVLYLVPDKSKMLHAVEQLDWRFVLVAVCLHTTAILADAGRLWFLCRGIGAPLPYLKIVQGIMASNFVSLITPFVSGGAPVIVWVLQQAGMDMSRASAAVVAGGIVSQSMLSVLALSLPLLSGVYNATDPYAVFLWSVVRTVVPLYLIGITAVALGSYRIDVVQRWIDAWESKLRGKQGRFPSRLGSALRSVSGGLQGYHHSFQVIATERPSFLIRAYLCSLVYFLGTFTVDWVIFRGLGERVSYLRTIAGQVIVWLVASATPTPGGEGAAEFGAFKLFTNILPPEKVAVFIVIWRILSYWLLIVVGAVALGFALRTSAERARKNRAS